MAEPMRPEIDEALCTNCGSCAEACLLGVIVHGDAGPTFDGPGSCLGCGHCVAVCPTGALTHPSLGDGATFELAAAPQVDSETLMRFMGRRRSTRSYQDRPVPPEIIERLLQAAVLAPSGHNAQNWAFSVITSPDRLAAVRERCVLNMRRLVGLMDSPFGGVALRLAGASLPAAKRKALSSMLARIAKAHEEGADRLLWGAPALIVAHAPSSDPTGAESCHYAIGNLMAMAVAEGLGTCLIGFVAEPAKRDRKLRELLAVPPTHSLHAALSIGYPTIRFARTVPKHQPDITFI